MMSWMAVGGVMLVSAFGSAAPLTMEQAVEMALTKHEKAQAFPEREKAAEARVAKARSFFFPNLTVSGQYTRRFQKDTETYLGTATANFVLFNARAFPLFRVAEHLKEADWATVENDRRKLTFDAMEQFLVTLSVEQVLAAAERRSAFAATRLSEAKARFDAQLASSNDVTRVTLEHVTADRGVTRARGDLQAAYLLMAQALGSKVIVPLETPEWLFAQAALPPEAESRLMERAMARPDVAAARARLYASRALAEEAGNRWIPDLSVSGQYRASHESPSSTRDSDWLAGALLTWSVFDGGAGAADGGERQANVRAAELNMQLLERQVGLQIEGAEVALATAQAVVKQAETAREAAKKNADEAAVLYRQGLARALEVADANVKWFEAEVDVARERLGVALAYLDLRRAVGLAPIEKKDGQ